MSAQPVHHAPGPVPAIPKTIDDVATALSPTKRMAFYAEVGKTPAADLETTVERWWTDAMLNRVPGRAARIDNVRARRNLVSLNALAEEILGGAG